jgi:hypothetical protein
LKIGVKGLKVKGCELTSQGEHLNATNTTKFHVTDTKFKKPNKTPQKTIKPKKTIKPNKTQKKQ